MESNEFEQLRADIEVLICSPAAVDFEIRMDPKDSSESHVGKRASSVESGRYLFDLSRYLDWGASKDREKATAAGENKEERTKYTKYADRGRRQAAVCRYYARKLTYTVRNVPF